MNVDFDPATHTYSRMGRPVPGVTETLRAAGLFPKEWDFADMRLAQQAGTVAHAACEGIIKGGNVEEIVHRVCFEVEGEYWAERTAQSVLLFGNFVADMQPELIASEWRLYSSIYGYAGTIDLVVRMRGWVWVIDLKTGFPYPAVDLQTAAYAQLVKENRSDLPIVRRGALYLRDKQYRLDPHESPDDFRVFQSALVTNAWKRRFGLTEAA